LFTTTGNTLALASGVAADQFGIAFITDLAGMVGALIELSALNGLVYDSRWLRDRMFAAPDFPEMMSASR
jgi:ACR3 family arsenite efflux pump ArsB